MDILANLALGFSVALSPYTLFLAVCGCFLGTIIGALPGLGPSNGVAILIPITFTLSIPTGECHWATSPTLAPMRASPMGEPGETTVRSSRCSSIEPTR